VIVLMMLIEYKLKKNEAHSNVKSYLKSMTLFIAQDILVILYDYYSMLNEYRSE
jgi:hypothetical protein